MLIQRKNTAVEYELFIWLAVMGLAIIMALLTTRVAGGSDAPPGMLPQFALDASIPIRHADDLPATRAVPAVRVDSNQPRDRSEASVRAAIQWHRSGDMERAIQGWLSVELAPGSEIWKHVALAAAQLRIGDLQAAAWSLDAADGVDSHNPVLHYYKGIWRLSQATVANQWYDAMGPEATRFANYRPPRVSPNSRSAYRLAAAMQLEAAIENSPQVDFSQPLIARFPQSASVNMVANPTVGDLLEAIGAGNFVGKAHNLLGGIYLDRGALELAETHMDEALARGMHVLDGFRTVAEGYVERGRPVDALRAYGKAAAQQSGLTRSLLKAIVSLP